MSNRIQNAIVFVSLLAFALSCSSGHIDEPAGDKYMTLISDSLMVIDSRNWNVIVEFESNVAVEMHVPDLGWLSESESDFSSESVGRRAFGINVSANDAYDERNAVVRFSSSEGNKFVTIVQKQKNAILMSSNKIEIDRSGGEVRLEVASNVSYDLKISDDAAGWVHLLSGDKTKALCDSAIVVGIDKNESAHKRSGELSLTAGDMEETVRIYQQGEAFEMILDSDSIVVNSDRNVVKVELKTNSLYSYQLFDAGGNAPNWIEPCDAEDMSSCTLCFSVKQNTTYESRCAFIHIDNDVNDEVRTVVIRQMPKEVLHIADKSYVLDFREQSLPLSVSSSVEVSCFSSADWITVEKEETKAVEDSGIRLLVAQNTTGESRTADVFVLGYELKDTLSVCQQAEPGKIFVSILHECGSLAVPRFPGENTFGTVRWGDGTVEAYDRYLWHTYNEQTNHEASFEVWGADGFKIDTLGKINVINILVN